MQWNTVELLDLRCITSSHSLPTVPVLDPYIFLRISVVTLASFSHLHLKKQCVFHSQEQLFASCSAFQDAFDGLALYGREKQSNCHAQISSAAQCPRCLYFPTLPVCNNHMTSRSSLFRYVTQRKVIVPKGCPETSVTTSLRCVTSQNSEDLGSDDFGRIFKLLE
jgi:hypothetical protein